MNGKKKNLGWLLSVALVAILAITLVPAKKAKAEPVVYNTYIELTNNANKPLRDARWNAITIPGISFSNGVYTFENVNFSTSASDALFTNSDVTIIVKGDNYIKSGDGSQGPRDGLNANGNDVTLKGDGTITFEGGKRTNGGSGESSYGIRCKSLYIKDCTVIAKGGIEEGTMSVCYSAGISLGENLTIDGANVTAQGSDAQVSNGIRFTNAAAKLTIKNGTLNVTGKTYAIDIASGCDKFELDSQSTITIPASNKIRIDGDKLSGLSVSSSNNSYIKDGDYYTLANTNENASLTIMNFNASQSGDLVTDFDNEAAGSIDVGFENKSSYYLTIPTNLDLATVINAQNGVIEKSVNTDGVYKDYKILQTNLDVSVHDGSLLYTDRVKVSVTADGVLKYGARKVDYKVVRDYTPDKTAADDKNYNEYSPFYVYWKDAELTSATTVDGKNQVQVDLAVLSDDYQKLTKVAAEYKTKIVFSAEVKANCAEARTGDRYKLALAEECLDNQLYRVVNVDYDATSTNSNNFGLHKMLNIGDCIILGSRVDGNVVKYSYLICVEGNDSDPQYVYYDGNDEYKTWNQLKTNTNMIYYCPNTWYTINDSSQNSPQ